MEKLVLVLLKPDDLYPTRPATQGNKPAKLKAISHALKGCDDVILATDCDREGQLIGQEIRNFKPEDYFEIVATTHVAGGAFPMRHAPPVKQRIKDRARADAIAQAAVDHRGALVHGWKAVCGGVDPEVGEEADGTLPPLTDGEAATPREPRVEAKRTAPPPRYNEGTLIDAMQNAWRFVEAPKMRRNSPRPKVPPCRRFLDKHG